MSKRVSTVLVVIFVAVGLAIAFAYSGFNTLTGTGVIGVGQVQPPGLDEAPDALSATGNRVTYYEWTCTQDVAVNPIVNHWWGTVTQGVLSDAIVRTNRHGKVQNYTFEGWVDVGDPVFVDTNQTYDGAPFPTVLAPACFTDFLLVEPWFEEVIAVEAVEFSY